MNNLFLTLLIIARLRFRRIAILAFPLASLLLNACSEPAPESAKATLAGSTDHFSIAASNTLHVDAPGVLANDARAGDEAITELVQPPRYGKLDFKADGSFSYEPRYKFTGHDAFTYALKTGNGLSEPIPVHISFPNVIVILVDDLGLGDLQIYNDAALSETPNLTALADAGIAFTQAHSTAAVCSPSRYSVLTGNLPHRGRISSGIWNTYAPTTMWLPGQQTLGDIFRDAGYQTALVGKLHNGAAFHSATDAGYTPFQHDIDYTRPFDRGPTQFGFDYSFLLPGGVSSRQYAYYENDRLVRFDTGTGTYKPFDDNAQAQHSFVYISQGWGATHNGGLIGAPGWAMDNYDSRQAGSILTRQALAFINRALDKDAAMGDARPFFLLFSPPELHTPYSPPAFFNPEHTDDSVPATSGDQVAGYSGISARTDMIREIDLLLGEITALLAERGQLEDTLIVFTSDNGPVWGKAEAESNPQGSVNGTPLHGAKGDIFEGGHRVPLLIRWGAGQHNWIAPGQRSNELVGLHDLAASFMVLLGQQRQQDQFNDSKSLAPLLLGKNYKGTIRDHLIVQGSPKSAAGNRSYIDRAFYQYDERGELWKFVVVSTNTDPLAELEWRALYNLSADPGEQNNLLNTEADTEWLATLKARYLKLISSRRTIDSYR